MHTRNAKILNKKFYEYIVPSILSGIAIALNEFVDSIIVANLLGSDAMNDVSMGMPIMTMYAMLYMLFGIGGSALYAQYMGKLERKEAGESLSVPLLTAGAISLAIFAAGIFGAAMVAGMLSGSVAASQSFIQYVRILLISAPLIIILQTLLLYLPSAGSPKLGSVLNMLANGINLCMDIVYIRVFKMDVEGAAWATFTGYAAAFAILLALLLFKKCPLQFARPKAKAFLQLKNVIMMSAASALGQLGLSIKVAFSIQIASSYGGSAAVTAFSACIQILSIVSILVCGGLDVLIPMVGVLYGQKDFHGIRYIIKNVIRFELISMVVTVLLLQIFPQIVGTIYNVTDPTAAALCIKAVRIFSLMFICRSIVLVYMYYLQIIDQTLYSVLISVMDGFAGIILLSYLLCPFFGLNGLWIAYTALSVILLIAILLINRIKAGRSSGPLDPLTLLEKEPSGYQLFDATIHFDTNELVDYVQELQKLSEEAGIAKSSANLLAVSVEEMCDYVISKRESLKYNEIDIITEIHPDRAIINFRSLGKPLDLMHAASTEAYSNVNVLKKLASSVEYDYVLGMNQSKVTVVFEK